MAEHTAPEQPRWPRVMESSARLLVLEHADGTRSDDVIYVVHAPGAEPADDWTLTAPARPAGWGRP